MFKYDEETFFAYARRAPFGGFLTQDQVSGCKAIISAWPAGTDIRWIAYALATAFHETASTMLPIREFGKGKGKKYGAKDRNKQVPYGRGYVQLTWADNYEKADAKLGLGGSLIKNYDRALEPEIAAQIMVRGMTEGWFTGKRLSTYFGKVDNPVGARAIINGKDKQALIASYHEQFLGALTAACKVDAGKKPKPKAAIARAAEPDEVPTAKSASIWTMATTFVGGGGITAFQSIDNPWALGGIALLVVTLAVGAFLLATGRISINRIIPDQIR